MNAHRLFGILIATSLACASTAFAAPQEAQAVQPVEASAPLVTASAPSSPSAIVPPAPAIVSAPLASPAPAVATAQAPLDPFATELKSHCARHFPGALQAETRTACLSAAADFQKLGKTLIRTRCRLTYGEEPPLVMACLVGTSIADDLVNHREDFKKKMQLCIEHYPMHTEIDAFLEESCLTGIHMPDLGISEGLPRIEACSKISLERSFVGPCAVGLSFAQDPTAIVKTGTGSAPESTAKSDTTMGGQQNKSCEQYFDQKQFHLGYRSCLVARGLGPDLPGKYSEALKSCARVVSESDVNDTERAACLVGVDIYRHLQRHEDVAMKFKKCGTSKVDYSARDILACLTAATLLDFTDKNGAESGCREVFRSSKSHSRGDCLNSLALF